MDRRIGSHGSSEQVDRAVIDIARTQRGLVTRTQARRAGLTPTMIERRLSSGRLERVFRGVYALPGAPASWERRLLAACLALDGDAVASMRAAARLWSAPGFTDEVLELSIPNARRRRLSGVIVHRPRDLHRVDRTRRHGIPATTMTRTIIDLAAVCRPEVIEEVLDDALRRRLTSVDLLGRRIAALRRSGRRGLGLVRTLVADRHRGLPESVFETRLLRVLRAAGLPPPLPQHEVRARGRFVARVDFAYPAVGLAIEADGFRHHSGRLAFEGDRARLSALAAAGWRVIHVTWRQMVDEPGVVVERIRAALDHGAALDPAAALDG